MKYIIIYHIEYRYVSSSPALGWVCWFCIGAVISPSPAVPPPPPSSLYGRFLEPPPAQHFLASDQSASCSFLSSVCSRASGSYCSQGLKYSRSVCVCVCVCVCVWGSVCASVLHIMCVSLCSVWSLGGFRTSAVSSPSFFHTSRCVCVCVVVINSWIHNEVTSICAAAETVSKKNQQDVCRLCPLFSSEMIWERHISQSCRSRWTSYRLGGGDNQYIHLFWVQNTVFNAPTATNCYHRHLFMLYPSKTP